MTGAAEPPRPSPLGAYLQQMVSRGASDLFLRAGSRPSFRIHGDVVRSELPAPDAASMEAFMDEVMTPVARDRFRESPDLDVACAFPGVGRFRVNLFLQQGRPALVARRIPPGEVPFDSLNLPPVIKSLADKQNGMILVVGPTGCGKSTTLAALVHHINATRAEHIVTIEDPVEFVHGEIRSLIHQRQVGYDTGSFATALRHVVRQSPDVILIGEMRDSDTVQTALAAALTGHLILSTLHTTNAVQSVDRMLNYFDPNARGQAQADLAATLLGIVAMRLVPTADGQGRRPACEILLGTPTAKRLVAEGEFVELYDLMKRSQDVGMCTLNQALVELCQGGEVDPATAVRYAPNPDEFRLNMEGMFTGIASIDLRTQLDDAEDS